MYLYLHAPTKALVPGVLSVDSFCTVKDVCHRALCTHHLAQQREQCKPACIQREFAVKMQNEKLFCLCFLIFFI